VDLAKTFKTKKGADYKQFSETACDDLDLSAFDLADMNVRLKKYRASTNNVTKIR